jgi:hypothetical protein
LEEEEEEAAHHFEWLVLLQRFYFENRLCSYQEEFDHQRLEPRRSLALSDRTYKDKIERDIEVTRCRCHQGQRNHIVILGKNACSACCFSAWES